jgi:hypothetical protein
MRKCTGSFSWSPRHLGSWHRDTEVTETPRSKRPSATSQRKSFPLLLKLETTKGLFLPRKRPPVQGPLNHGGPPLDIWAVNFLVCFVLWICFRSQLHVCYVERKKENGNLRLRYSGGGPPWRGVLERVEASYFVGQWFKRFDLFRLSDMLTSLALIWSISFE